MISLDKIDRKILRFLQVDGRMTNAELAEKINLSPSACLRRVQRIEDSDIVDGYVIEGHVPANDITRLLQQRPEIVGLTAPGMPMQSPGMQKPGLAPKNYDVLAFDADGTSHVFSRY
ncbi:MAG: hypothetical protein COB59_08990 [Rhodospirillaceae bacterium]|nr:MAG: hypothetical protein COB59_08990 [Rhodospirillaceae bacterium]